MKTKPCAIAATEKMKSAILFPYGPLSGSGCCRMVHGKHLAVTSAIYTLRNFVVTWKNCTTTTYSPKIDEFKLEMDISNNMSVVGGYFILNESVATLKVRNIVIVSLANGNLRRIFDYTLDTCRVAKMPPRSSIAAIIWNDMAKFGHIPKGCPIPANKNFSITDFLLDADYFPPYSSELTFIIQTTAFFESKLAAAIETVARIESQRKKRH